MAIYMDYAATTPVDPRVVEAMTAAWRLDGVFGNPSSAHAFGRAAKAAVEGARREVAELVGATPPEVIFTSGATEADNLAVLGLMRASGRRRLLVGATEHHAVLHAADEWRRQGGGVDVLPVDDDGRPRLDLLPDLLTRETGLVSLMLGNNEVGTKVDLAPVVAAAHAVGALVHSDAVQAVGFEADAFRAAGVDALSLSAHKLYGPKGVGALVVRQGIAVEPLLVGGGQERGRRAGTENVPAIVGFGRAAAIARAEGKELAAQLYRLAAALEAGLMGIAGARCNGPHLAARLPHVVNVSFTGVEGESLVLSLDLEGVAVSSGSACTSGSLSPSHVLLAMGRSEAEAAEAVRFSLGRGTRPEEVERVVALTDTLVARIRTALSSSRRKGVAG